MNDALLTIKHVTPLGFELTACSRVYLQHENRSLNSKPTLFADLPNGQTMMIDAGSVFVMNAAGKTIEQIHFPTDMPTTDEAQAA
jgi:hypothetical protein